ncbi:MAG: cob(I)yrinic acid a,c-diamide adenosyltransferase [Patescibacteria group bacterium]|nr:cob(I)yrinic acid a,c-diamide adenosyltransferase [Patescibacteria group bacterium]
MIMVFTGNGKGKTTAAIGQAVRSAGQNKKTLIIKFIKGLWISGEDLFISNAKNKMSKNKKIVGIEIIKTGKGFVKILNDKLPFSEHKKAAENGLKIAEKAIKEKKYDLIVLDEINNAVDLKLVSVKKVLDILNKLPKKIDIILTGRNAPKSFIKKADLVTEMKEIKHTFNKGALAKKGIEY